MDCRSNRFPRRRAVIRTRDEATSYVAPELIDARMNTHPPLLASSSVDRPDPSLGVKDAWGAFRNRLGTQVKLGCAADPVRR